MNKHCFQLASCGVSVFQFLSLQMWTPYLADIARTLSKVHIVPWTLLFTSEALNSVQHIIIQLPRSAWSCTFLHAQHGQKLCAFPLPIHTCCLTTHVLLIYCFRAPPSGKIYNCMKTAPTINIVNLLQGACKLVSRTVVGKCVISDTGLWVKELLAEAQWHNLVVRVEEGVRHVMDWRHPDTDNKHKGFWHDYHSEGSQLKWHKQRHVRPEKNWWELKDAGCGFWQYWPFDLAENWPPWRSLVKWRNHSHLWVAHQAINCKRERRKNDLSA